MQEISCGVIPIYKKDSEYVYLLIKHAGGHWSFPKGRKEGTETDQETALRELREETGIKQVSLHETPFIEEYTYYRADEKIYKTVYFFIGIVPDQKVSIDNHEIIEFKWCVFEEALKTLTFSNAKELLDDINGKLNGEV